VGEKREIVCRYVGNGLNVSNAVSIAGIKKSTYYYQSNGRPKGKRPSTHTIKYNEGLVANDVVVEELINLISPEYHDYGYKVSSELLKRKGYIINHKKVNRLMRDNNLLHPQMMKQEPLNKLFIKYTCPPLDGPFKTIEADIKYVYIHEDNRNAFLLTFLCTFCRYAPVWELQYSMRSTQVIDLVMDFINHPIVKENIDQQKTKIIIRTDNGPQFIAKKLASALDTIGLTHEFINPGTPQQNGHIESFHSTVTRLVCNRNIFKDLTHARDIFKEFFQAYNNTRVMKALLYYPPKTFLKLWESGFVGIKKDKRNREIFFFREKPLPILEVGFSAEDLYAINKNNKFEIPVSNLMEISPVL
jgi:transposase InsO family protein